MALPFSVAIIGEAVLNADAPYEELWTIWHNVEMSIHLAPPPYFIEDASNGAIDVDLKIAVVETITEPVSSDVMWEVWSIHTPANQP